MNKWNNSKTENLISAILALKNKKEAKLFLRDLLTEKELLELGNRWKAARMLQKKNSYEKIEKKTGLSSRTIARISAWLANGRGGYRLMISRMNKKHSKPFPVPRKG